jgi:formamidopyrimidine-DNA glycosylase
MPELPDVELYREAIAARVMGERLETVRLDHPFVLRTAVPSIAEAEGRRVREVRRLGKRIVLALDDALFLVIHLMIAGRLLWLGPGAKAPRRITLARFEFPPGTLALTEAGSKRRASLHLVRGAAALAAFDPGGLDVLGSDVATFAARLRHENHTLKRALTDPHILSGIGNAYSDEILHRAKLSPLALTSKVSDAEMARLHAATRAVLDEWTQRLRAEAAGAFPVGVTAFRPEMAVHGRYRQPCPVCGAPVQRIVYAANECNYCARCQTGGRLLADRSLSRLLKASWPRSLDDAEG